MAGATSKYVTVTGNRCEDYEYGDRTQELQVLLDKFMRRPEIQLIFNESDFVKDQFTLMSNATTIEVIYSYSLKDILLPVIPADEQEKIYAYLSKKCIAIDGIIAEKQKALATITQHKKSLIYEYVTGKKRVKEVQ